jgi:ketosteroid isomerase-like protein
MSGSAGRAALVLTIAISVFAASFAHAATSRSSDEAGVKAILEYNAQTLKALNAGDVDALNALMADDYVIFLPNRPPIQGIDGIKAANRSFLGQWNDVETWTPDETRVSGNWGFQRGTFLLLLTPKAGGATRRAAGSYLHIYERKPTGKWMLTRAMTTTLPDAPVASAAGASTPSGASASASSGAVAASTGASAAPLTADDRLAIMNLIAHYAQSLDSGDADAYAANFTPDGVAEWANGSARGRDQIKTWVGGLMKAGGIGATPAQIRHFVNMPDISGEGGRATARTYVTIFGLSKTGTVNVPSVASYTDTLVKQDGRWFFAKRVMKADLGVFAKRND